VSGDDGKVTVENLQADTQYETLPIIDVRHLGLNNTIESQRDEMIVIEGPN
jgi:hypothetical protein